jgi:hypothetical protein
MIRISASLHIVLFFVFLACIPTSVLAGNGGSAYSRYGLGDIQYFGTSRGMGMGGAGLAVLSTNSIDRLNPAAWGYLNRVRFSIDAMYEGYSTSDSKKSTYLSETRFGGFMFAVPLLTDWGFVFSGGITPFSNINYNIITPSSENGLNYAVQYLGQGGLSQAQAGFSVAIRNELYLGMKLNYYFGTMEHTIKQTFTQGENTEVDRSNRMNGLGLTVGAIYDGLRKVFNLAESNSLNLGLVVTTTSYLTAAEERYYTYSTSSLVIYDTATTPDQKICLPFAVGGGITYLSDRFLIASDLYYQNWSKFTMNSTSSAEFRDSYRFSLGGELIPKRDLALPFFERLAYQLGIFYNATYYKIRGESINEIGLAGGFSIPIFTDTRLSVAAQYSLRDATKEQLQKDKILSISFTLSTGELWFVHTLEE